MMLARASATSSISRDVGRLEPTAATKVPGPIASPEKSGTFERDAVTTMSAAASASSAGTRRVATPEFGFDFGGDLRLVALRAEQNRIERKGFRQLRGVGAALDAGAKEHQRPRFGAGEIPCRDYRAGRRAEPGDRVGVQARRAAHRS